MSSKSFSNVPFRPDAAILVVMPVSPLINKLNPDPTLTLGFKPASDFTIQLYVLLIVSSSAVCPIVILVPSTNVLKLSVSPTLSFHTSLPDPTLAARLGSPSVVISI